jgi:hypothetical protein
MGKSVLRMILMNNDSFELDDMLYVADDAELRLDTDIDVLPADASRPARIVGQRYLLGVEQVRGAIEAAEGELQRVATLRERFAAVKHFAENDAFMPIEDLLNVETYS